jgi:hypothetical protein
MRQKYNARTIKPIRQMTEALDIRATGASFSHVGKSLKLPDVNAARMLLRISTMISRLHGLE